MKTLHTPATEHRQIQDEDVIPEFYICKVSWHLQESNAHLFHVELMSQSVAVWELGGDHHWLLRHHVLASTTPIYWGLIYPTNFILFLVDTCSLLIAHHGRMRLCSLNFGSYEEFLDATGKPFFHLDYVAYCQEFVDATTYDLTTSIRRL